MMVDGALGPVINADTTEIIWDPCLHFHSSNHNMFHLRLLSQGMDNRELTPVDMQSFFAKSPSVGRADGCRGDDGGSCSEGLGTAQSALSAAASSRRHPAQIRCSCFHGREIHGWLRGPGRPDGAGKEDRGCGATDRRSPAGVRMLFRCASMSSSAQIQASRGAPR